MNHAIYIVDAFAEQRFSGNPAAVCLLNGDADDRWMQAVATEMNLSETAFLRQTSDNEWALRWFTPTMEVDLCGHATLASAHVLWHEIGIQKDVLRFNTRSGWLSAERSGEWIHLDFPVDRAVPSPIPEGLEQTLGAGIEAFCQGRQDLLVVLERDAVLRGLAPNMQRLAKFDTRAVIVTAPSDLDAYDFVSRCFAPRAGIPEDPVTGAAHCTLGPYWGERLAKQQLRGFQASKRGGVVGVDLQGERVRLRGKAITTLQGQLRA
ncbi:MAG: PhzF family phenazine biosynthesis isomerase [Candidatus Thiodiazotropha taylori]